MTASNPLQNLFIDVQGGTQSIKPGGDPVQRTITVHNRGDRLAEIELWLEPVDERAEPLRRWSSFSKSDSELRLSPGEATEVILSFVAPLQAEPGFYGYELRAQSPQYPGESAQRSQQLQVLPPDQETRRTEPQISLTPATDSNHPHPLRPGTEMVVQITVENPSLRTDRFFATCSDIPSDWFTVEYPEDASNIPGIVAQTHGLQLNPRESGDIRLRLHPPAHTLAGNYFPTIRVTSSNRPDLVLLEIIYLTLPISDRLTLSLNPASRKLPAADDFFEVLLTNPGNIERDLLLTAQDEERKFKFAIVPDEIHLAPGESALSLVQPRPRHRWRQLWRRRDQTITFDVDVHNAGVLDPLPEDTISDRAAPEPIPQPSLPESIPVGKIHWQARRRWLFWLLVAALGLGLLTTVALLLWYLLFWRPSLRPQITEFSPTGEDYREEDPNNQAGVTLDWEITNLNKIGTIELILTPQPGEAVRTRQYQLNQENIAIPKDLEPFCQKGEAQSQTSILANLLRVQRRFQTNSPNTPVIQCRGVAITGLMTEHEAEKGRSAIAPADNEFAFTEGTYEFTLRVYPQQEDTFSQETTKVVVGPPPPPEVVSLAATATEYSLVTPSAIGQTEAAISVQPVSAPASTNNSSTTESPEPRPLAPIKLNWEVSNLADISELKLVSLAPDGSENVPAETFDFSNGIPALLLPYCQGIDNQLICTEVPTTATDVGEYVFYLSVVPTDNATTEDIVASTATIPIKPPTPKILNFTLNGESISDRPKRVLVVNPARVALDLKLAWEVEDATQVELLPAPGVVQGDTLTYTVSAAPGSETITLRAVNELEEEVTQTVVVEKVGYELPQSATAPDADGNSVSPNRVLPPPLLPPVVPVPLPPNPSPLPPAEEPPRAN